MRDLGTDSQPIQQCPFGIGREIDHPLSTALAEHLQSRALSGMLRKQAVHQLKALDFADS